MSGSLPFGEKREAIQIDAYSAASPETALKSILFTLDREDGFGKGRGVELNPAPFVPYLLG
ncbi:hypothetical protein L249_1638 [Ophiocordyceps polyrhachis-furcata BCC 54312]|uniref:Uncharacterized protein n=1 Tax=Ophiocordyceps polyrhachis-furcata BCC 54312 TaxID=1330021 RepID=A0A367KZN1_9HYPO|nr:hypothetical protein L249_1638 [Ophiocordyceps polyrhachis-furcata BCC 54312]